MQESEKNILTTYIAMPRLHRNFQSEPVQLLDPLQKEEQYFVFPVFPWTKATAQQCFYDFKQNATEFAKDKKGALQSFDVYNMQKTMATLSAEEVSALMEFTGEKEKQNSFNPLEILQQILILALYKEEQYLELQEISQKIQTQQEKLTFLLDKEKDIALQENDEYLPKWQYVFYAILAFTQKNHFYFINDKTMAQAFFAINQERFAIKEIAEKNYYYGTIQKDDFLSFIPENFRSYVPQTELTVLFITDFIE